MFYKEHLTQVHCVLQKKKKKKIHRYTVYFKEKMCRYIVYCKNKSHRFIVYSKKKKKKKKKKKSQVHCVLKYPTGSVYWITTNRQDPNWHRQMWRLIWTYASFVCSKALDPFFGLQKNIMTKDANLSIHV